MNEGLFAFHTIPCSRYRKSEKGNRHPYHGIKYEKVSGNETAWHLKHIGIGSQKSVNEFWEPIFSD